MKRGREIRELEKELKKSRVSQLANDEMLTDFGMQAERDEDSPADENLGDFEGYTRKRRILNDGKRKRIKRRT